MILVAFLCFALLFIAWLIAPGLERSPRSIRAIDTLTDPVAANAHI